MRADLQVITPDWSAPTRIRAAFTLRSGGVSAAPYDSLNLGTGIGDSPQAVAENRRRIAERLALPSEPVWLEQVHGTSVVEIGRDASLVGDASVTRVSGRVCAIRVADCLPVLFAARDGSAVGAAHGGWRGLAGGVLETTIARLGISPRQLIAWMGPAIGPRNFEVGDDVRDAFLARDAGTASAFTANARGRWQCDLYSLARHQLRELGVSAVSGGGWCTFAERDRFFSYRRDGQCGRMAALVWIDPERT